MKHSGLVAFLLLWLLAGCGKVGDPRPPAIRIPAKVNDLKVVQNQYEIVLSWTNPARYVDGSAAKDLNEVRILRDGKSVKTLPTAGAGKPQSTNLQVKGDIGAIPVYTIEVGTQRGKVSDSSNSVSIPIVDVPGLVVGLTGFMDQHRIQLDWKPPDQNASFADVYIVRREDGVSPPKFVTETHFEDETIETGKVYSYVVTAARGNAPTVPGPPSSPILVTAEDKKAPATPTGLQPPVVSDTVAILRWNSNTELDIAGYHIYRSDNPDSGFTLLNTVLHTIGPFRDEAYRPGAYYEVSAVDSDGNESALSAPVRAP